MAADRERVLMGRAEGVSGRVCPQVEWFTGR